MITRTRRSPRKHSFSFQTLGWLIALEASWMICCDGLPGARTRELREDFFKSWRAYPTRPGLKIIERIPARRFRG
jgi:hypothetical protein